MKNTGCAMCTVVHIHTVTKPNFYLKIPWTLKHEECEFCEKWDCINVNFVTFDGL